MAAVDLQSCGVTSSGAVCLQELVHANHSLVLLDLRANELIGEAVLGLGEGTQKRQGKCCTVCLRSVSLYSDMFYVCLVYSVAVFV